jgi:hypothetical protein
MTLVSFLCKILEIKYKYKYNAHLYHKAWQLIASSGNITGYKQRRQDDKEIEAICKKL